MPERNCYLVRSNKALEYSSDKTSGTRGCSTPSKLRNEAGIERCPHIFHDYAPDDYEETRTEENDYASTIFTSTIEFTKTNHSTVPPMNRDTGSLPSGYQN